MLRKNTLNKNIPEHLYKKIVEHMPICCVDIVFKVGKEVYLFKRAHQPAKNEWWLIGGRILKGERLKDAVLRKAKEEIGVDAKILKVIGVYETFFPESRFNTKTKKIDTHSISICFVIEPKHKNFNLKLNEEYICYKKITEIDGNLYPYVKMVLRDSGAIS